MIVANTSRFGKSSLTAVGNVVPISGIPIFQRQRQLPREEGGEPEGVATEADTQKKDICRSLHSTISPTASSRIEGAANTSLPISTWKMTVSGFLTRMVSGSSPAALTSHLEDSPSL